MHGLTISVKYVNMTDINTRHEGLSPATMAAPPPEAIDLIELLFFAYRDFTSDPDAILAHFGFGRAHHRVLHFVNRNPGLTVADLLSILKITKQSLGRVLRQLVECGFVAQRAGPVDRRQRLLYTTQQGQDLAARLSQPQSRRIMRALRDLEPEARETVARFLYEMIDPDDRKLADQLVGREHDVK